MRRLALLCALAVGLGCAPATEVLFEFRTDVPCDDWTNYGIQASAYGEGESAAFEQVLSAQSHCTPEGTTNLMGTYAVAPRDGATGVSLRVALATKGFEAGANCTSGKGYEGCIVARRDVRFVPKRGLVVPIDLLLVCRDVACDARSTCGKLGRCQSSAVDTTLCGPQGTVCKLEEPTPTDAGFLYPPAAFTSSWAPEPSVLPVGASTTLSLTLLDAKKAPVPGVPVTVSATGASNLWVTSSVGTTNDAGQFSAVLSSSVPGEKVVTVRAAQLALQTRVTFIDTGVQPDGGGADGGPDAGPDGGPALLPDGGVLTWREQAFIKATNPGENFHFGAAFALSGDGTTLAVGAPDEASNAECTAYATVPTTLDQNNTGAANSGAVYVYRRVGTGPWEFKLYLKSINTQVRYRFGASVALSADGTLLAVGSPGEGSVASGVNGNYSDTSQGGSGAVFIFRRTGETWKHESYLKAFNSDYGDGFGAALALSGDGTVVAIGTPWQQGNGSGVDPPLDTSNGPYQNGAVYLYRATGTTWTRDGYFKASNPGYGDHFGAVLALAGDGATLAVAAPDEGSASTGVSTDPDAGSDDAADKSGAVYVFHRAAANWTQQAYVKASNTGIRDAFGSALSLSFDGSTLSVGAPEEGSSNIGINGVPDESAASAGAAYVYRRSGSTWAQQAYVKPSNSERSDRFGSAVALAASGNALAVGAPEEAGDGVGPDPMRGYWSTNGRSASGAVYTFLFETDWRQESYLKSTQNTPNYTWPYVRFGAGLGLSSDGRRMVVIAPDDRQTATGVNGTSNGGVFNSAGAAFLLERP